MQCERRMLLLQVLSRIFKMFLESLDYSTHHCSVYSFKEDEGANKKFMAKSVNCPVFHYLELCVQRRNSRENIAGESERVPERLLAILQVLRNVPGPSKTLPPSFRGVASS